MNNDTTLPYSFPAVCTKKISAAFYQGRISSDGGVMLLALAERKLAIADKLAAALADRRDPTRTIHTLADILRRPLAICVWL
jgi:Transposase DDE domain group 1